MIQVKDLTKKYGSKTVLDNLNLFFDKGKVYGIVGENGAGKTTLFKCIAGLESHSGQISTAVGYLKDQLGILFTTPYFFAKMTAKEYLRLLLNARKINVADKAIADKNIFDLPLDQYADTYSTGMKKKLALAAILLQKNQVYILDEPYNGVDIQSNLIITELILKLKSLGKTVLISSHIFATLAESCDEIFVLKGGVIADKVLPKDFPALEAQMKQFSLGDRLDKLELQ